MTLINYPIDINAALMLAIEAMEPQKVDLLIQSGANVNSCTPSGQPLLHLAIQCGASSIAQNLLRCGANPHSVSTESYSEGCTPLHLASLKNDHELIKLLITHYNADPRIVAADGSQPIHFALFNGNGVAIQLMLDRFVNPETLVTKAVFFKYNKGINFWCNEFGDCISLLTFAILYNKHQAIIPLIDYGANARIKLCGNKTLLMITTSYQRLVLVRYLVAKLSRADLDCSDDKGFTALHHLFACDTPHLRNPSKGEQSRGVYFRSEIVKLLVNNGADMNTSIRGDPSTLLINMVAYLRDFHLLDFLLPRQKFSPVVQPFHYAMMPSYVKYPSDYLHLIRNDASLWYASFTMIDTIMKDMKMRIAMRYPVVLQEIERLNRINPKYLQENEYYKVVEQLRFKTLTFNNKKLSLYDVLSKTDSELQKLVTDKYFLQALANYQQKAVDDEQKIITIIKVRVDEVSQLSLMNKITTLSFLPSTLFHYIPFELVLRIVKYLNIYDVRSFLNAYS